MACTFWRYCLTSQAGRELSQGGLRGFGASANDSTPSSPSPASVSRHSCEHEVAPEVLLGRQGVMSLAAHRQISYRLSAAERVRKPVVQLEKSSFATMRTMRPQLVDEAALEPIPVPHFPPYGSWAALARKLRTLLALLPRLRWTR